MPQAGMELLSPRAVLGEFLAPLEAENGLSWLNRIAMGPMDATSELGGVYPFLGHVPTLKPTVGPPKLETLNVKSIVIANSPFDVALGIRDEERRHDQTGQLMVRVAEFGEAQSVHWLELVSPILAATESLESFTGSAFHASNHVWGKSGTQSNLLVLSAATDFPDDIVVTDPENPPIQAVSFALRAAAKVIRNLKSDQGKYMNMMRHSFTALCSSRSYDYVDSAISLPILGGGELNLLASQSSRSHKFTPELNPYLDASFDGAGEFNFILFADDAPRKSLILQGERLQGGRADGFAPNPNIATAEAGGVRVSVLGDGTEFFVLNKQMGLFADSSRGVGLGDPFVSCKVRITA